jgi:hypothetical protein
MPSPFITHHHPTALNEMTAIVPLTKETRGRLVRDRGSGKPKMTCRNWYVTSPEQKQYFWLIRRRSCRECGVLMRAQDAENQGPAASGGSPGGDLRVFEEGRVPVPMEWPGRGYASSGGVGGSAAAAAAAATPWFRPE